MKEIKGSAILLVLTLALLCFFGGFLLGSSSPGTQVQVFTQKAETTEPVSETPAATDPIETVDPDQVVFPININTADAGLLMELPGIGETYARRIVAYREENGPFGEIADIMEVNGIGEKRFANIKDYITVEDEHEDTGS